MQLRVDAAGCSTQIAQACRQRNIEFFMTARSNDEVTTAIDHNRFDRDTWQPALGGDGEPSKRAQVAELTDSVDLEGWPERTRFIARREPHHRGAQRTLFDSEQWRYRGFHTPQMATMARTRPNSALLKKMDPAPAALVARHSATTARQPTRRPIDATARRPQPPPKL